MHAKAKVFVTGAHFIWAVSLICLGVWTGYRLRNERADAASISPANVLPPLEDLVAPESFSRIGNAKQNLEALCVRLRLEIQSRFLRVENVGGEKARHEARLNSPLESMLHGLEQGMREFEGTEQELVLTQDLLLALKRAGHLDRWIEVYLNTLYEHPTQPVVSRFAREAIAIGRAIGREETVLAGLRHLNDIPLEFEGKATVQAALLEATPHAELAHLYPISSPSTQ